MLNCDVYEVPETLDAVFDLMERYDGHYRIAAGTTDLLPWAREGRAGDVYIPALIDVTRVPELQGVTRDGDRIRMGANTTIQQFLKHPVLRAQFPVMPQCAVWFADDQIREQATVGGNLVNASPAADTTPALLAMNGSVEVIARTGGQLHSRSMPISEFVTGPSRTALQDGELLASIECDAMGHYGGSFKKVGQRRSLVISVACSATLVQVDPSDQTVTDVRMAFGGIGPVPARIPEIENAMRGQSLTLQAITDALEQLPPAIIRSRSRREYRWEATRNFVAESIVEAIEATGMKLDANGVFREVKHA